MNTKRSIGLAAVASLAFGLGACGGGGGSSDSSPSASPATADSVPVSALTSTATFVDYQTKLEPSNTIEPLSLQQQLPPLSDTTEPTPIS